MNILGFNASPRKRGNTAWVIDQVLQGARDQGAQTRSWHFCDLTLKPCQGCLACKQGEKQCIIDDDMHEIYGALEQAHTLVLGSPIYLGQMSAQAKIFTDRLFAVISPRFSPHYKERTAGKLNLILAFTQGNPDPGMFRVYIDYTKYMFQLLEFEVKDPLVVAGTRLQPAQEKEGLQAFLKDLGSSLT